MTREEIDNLKYSLADSLIANDKFEKKTDHDILIGAGSHFAVLVKNPRRPAFLIIPSRSRPRGLLLLRIKIFKMVEEQVPRRC